MSGMSVWRIWRVLALALVVMAGCERPGAADPLAVPTSSAQTASNVPTATPEEFPPAAGTQAVINATPAPSATPLAQANATSQPTPIPAPSQTPGSSAQLTTPTATLPPGTGTTYTVQSGDRLFSIGRKFGVNPYSIAQLNNIAPPYVIHPGDVLKIPAGGTVTPQPGGKTHTVAPGENLFRIALRYSTTVQAIAAANRDKITNVNLIFVGQVLTIP